MKNKWLYWCGLVILVFFCLPVTAWAADSPVGVEYRGHIQDIGNFPQDENSWIQSAKQLGTTGECKRIEGFRIRLTGTDSLPAGASIRYNVHVENVGWLAKTDLSATGTWLADGAFAGSEGHSQRVEAIQIVLTGADGQALPGYSVQYLVHGQDYGWTQGWQADGAIAGTTSQSKRLEAIQIRIMRSAVGEARDAYSALQKTVAGLQSADYTAATWAVLQTAITENVVDEKNTAAQIIASIAAIQKAVDGLAKKPEPVIYDQAGTYGPATGTQTIAGDVTVAADGVVLQNLTIAGNLTISEAVGDGNVTLNNVTVKGDTLVRGGGVHSIKINGGKYSRIIMEKTASGAVRIVATGVDGLPVTISEAAAGETIILEGAFASVTVNAPNMNVTTQGSTTTIGTMTVSAGAAGSTVTVAAGTTVSDLLLNGKAAVKGQGNVAKTEVKADGVVFDKKPGAVTVEPGVVIPPVFPTPDSGGGYTPPAPIAVSGVSLNKTALTLSFNTSETLVATVAPSGATNQAVTWTSSDNTIATVDATGKVTGSANKEGTATITVTSADGAKSASCTVTVTRFKLKIAADGTGIIAGINGSSTDIAIPETIGGLTITAIGDEAFKNCSHLTDVTIPKPVISIGKDAFGFDVGKAPTSRSYTFRGDVPTTMGAGALPTTAPIPTIKYYANYSGYTAAAWAGYTNKSVILAKPELNTPTVTNTGTPVAELSWNSIPGATGYLVDVSENSDLSTATSVTVSEAKAIINTGLAAGKSYYFAVKAHDGYGESLLSEVKSVAVPYPNPVGSVTLDKTSLSLGVSENAQLTATIAPADATNQAVSWKSSDDSIATVGTDGTVNGLKEGSAMITVSTQDGNKTATCPVTVKDLKQDINGVTVPFAGETPVKTIAATSQYSGTVSWQKKVGSSFIALPAGEKFDGTSTYQATITLSLGTLYAPADILENFFKVAGATTTNDANALVITAVFVPTDQYKITSIGKITAYSGPGGNVSVPAMVNNTAVNDIGENAFKNQTAITTITLPATVTSINKAAFSGCTGLMAVTVTAPSVLKTIGYEAFSGCTALAGITIPQSVTVIYAAAFDGCTSLTAVTFAAGADLKTIGGSAFHNCNQLQSIAIPDQVTAIEASAFGYCQKLNSISFTPASGLERIDTNAFNSCTALTEITIPATVTSLGAAAFNNCAALQKITILGRPTAIELQTFENCSTLEAISIPDSVTSIGISAFRYCPKLTAITFRGAAPSLGTNAIAAGTIISRYAKETGFNTGAWSSYTKADILAQPVVKTLTVTNTGTPAVDLEWNQVTNASAYDVFVSNTAGSYGVATRTVAATTTTITNLDSSKTYYFVIKARDAYGESPLSDEMSADLNIAVSGVSINPPAVTLNRGATTTLTAVLEPANAANKVVTWSSSDTAVATVGTDGTVNGLKEGSAMITVSTQDGNKTATCNVNVTPPTPIRAEEITAVAEPFVGRTPATSFAVMLSDNTTREYSGTVAWTETGTTTPVTTFDGSKAYTATLTLTAEPGYQFATGTTFSVAGADSVTTAIGANGLTATVTANYAVKDRYELNGFYSITAYSGPGGELVVPGTIDGTTVAGINSSAFSFNNSLTKVTLPDTIQNLSEISFDACVNLKAINIPKDLTSIPAYCFFSCSKLETVIIPSEASLQTIDENAFSLTNLKTMAIPATVTAIGKRAFENCDQLTTATFTANSQLKTIGENAFNSCALTELNLPATVTAIGGNAFAANKLTKVTLNSSDGAALTIGKDAFMGSEESGHNLITEITLPANVSIPDSTITGYATMGLYGAAFKSFYESTETGGNNSVGGTFVYNTNQWSKKN